MSEAIAGEHRAVMGGYLREFLLEDPLIHVALMVQRPVLVVEHHVDRRTVRRSRAYHDFHRVYGFEHHMLVRFYGEHIREPGALSMGFTRNRRLPEFGARERRIAELVLPALQGAARRIATNQFLPAFERDAAPLVAERGLTTPLRPGSCTCCSSGSPTAKSPNVSASASTPSRRTFAAFSAS